MAGLTVPSINYVSSNNFGFRDPVPTYTYDVEKAKELLAQEGVEPGSPLVIMHTEGRYYGDRQVSEAMQGMFKLGFWAGTQAAPSEAVSILGDQELANLPLSRALAAAVPLGERVGLGLDPLGEAYADSSRQERRRRDHDGRASHGRGGRWTLRA